MRWPSTEGGSAALAEQLHGGRPVIVTRTGVFDEIPDDAVLKVPPNDPAAVAAELSRLIDGETVRHVVGRAGWEVARTFTIEEYARRIHQVATDGVSWALTLEALDRVGHVLSELNVVQSVDILETLGAEVSQLFGVEFSEGRPMARRRTTTQ